ncbi:isochorismatase family cysteine hydrolase [Geodermatophilus sp. CPCC 206100]|uniref:isochorismatase family cysteine hydrolase n=1 Tax=Geodermatophilus sp. CPCC 206100 TaxID=3020054 RepID=UPI003AFF88C2
MGTWPGDPDPHTAPELDRSALVVVDTQVDFVDGGASPVPGTTQVVPVIGTLLRAYRAAALPVVHVVRLYTGDDVDLPRRALVAAGSPLVRPGSAGSQIVPALRPPGAPDLDPDLLLGGGLQVLADREWAIWKPRWGSFHRTRLDEQLRGQGVSTVVLAGCNYPNCPRATVYGASERDYRVLLVSDAISGVRGSHLEEAGLLGVRHATAGEVVRELAARADRVTAP